MLNEISRSEQHFNTLEAEYRKLASTWLLAAFAGMGYIATAKDLPINPGITIFAVSVGASLGIQLLWIVDLMTYHRLLLAYFAEGLRLEKQPPSLPQIRSTMLAHTRTSRRVRFFYLGTTLCPLAFGVAAYFSIDQSRTTAVLNTLVVLIAAVLVVFCMVLMIKTTGKSPNPRFARKTAAT